MIEYTCKIPEDDVNSITPTNLQEHITVLDLCDMRDGNICNFVQRFYKHGVWHHRYFVETKNKAYNFVNQRHAETTWKYFFKFIELKGLCIQGPCIKEVEINLDEVRYYF